MTLPMALSFSSFCLARMRGHIALKRASLRMPTIACVWARLARSFTSTLSISLITRALAISKSVSSLASICTIGWSPLTMCWRAHPTENNRFTRPSCESSLFARRPLSATISATTLDTSGFCCWIASAFARENSTLVAASARQLLGFALLRLSAAAPSNALPSPRTSSGNWMRSHAVWDSVSMSRPAGGLLRIAATLSKSLRT
mmetsp:Transcript_39313/g.112489  ORF Transcript_39313/g.112489 Transcript_39313/m.112489 type:complete len:203 (-) Transcript_39313:270-878(-)